MQEIVVTVLTIAVLLLAVVFAVIKIVKDKKAGIGSCGCKCSECPHACPHHK